MFQAQLCPWLPQLVFGIMSLIAGALVMALPETRGRQLPTTIAEVEAWERNPPPPEKKNSIYRHYSVLGDLPPSYKDATRIANYNDFSSAVNLRTSLGSIKGIDQS